MNWETTLLGEVPQKSELRECLCLGISTLLDGVGSSRHSTELHWLRGRRIVAGQIPGLACPVVMNAAVVQVKGEPNYKVVCWFVLQDDVSSEKSAVQEQSDTW